MFPTEVTFGYSLLFTGSRCISRKFQRDPKMFCASDGSSIFTGALNQMAQLMLRDVLSSFEVVTGSLNPYSREQLGPRLL